MGYWSMQFGWGVEKKVSRFEVAQKGMLRSFFSGLCIAD